MRTAELAILRQLMLSDKPISASSLSLSINVSTRTIRNYIQEINTSTQEAMITSSNKGYVINNKELISMFLQKNDNALSKIPENETDRIFFIIESLLKSKEPVDTNSLAETLYISYSTIKAVISSANRLLSPFDVQIISRNNILKLDGLEQNKRKVVSYYLYEKSKNDSLSVNYLKEYFSEQLVNNLIGILKRLPQKYQLTFNEFAFKNLILHLGILIDRNTVGSIINSCEIPLYSTIEDSEMIAYFEKSFKTVFELDLSIPELNQIFILVKSNSNVLPSNTQGILDNLISKQIRNDVQTITDTISTRYYFELDKKVFTIPFSIHLKALYERIHYGNFIRNPLVNNIKKNSPLLYDMAISIADIINGLYSCNLPEDEIAFIALHLGNVVAQQKENETKIPTVLIIPQYLDLDKKIQDKIILDFSDKVNVLHTFTNSDELKSFPVTPELVLTMNDLTVTDCPSANIIKLNPFYNFSTRNLISNKIEEIEAVHRRNLLIKNFDNFFNEDLFEIMKKDDYSINYLKILERAAEDMYNKNYVDRDFVNGVLKRENMSTTSFGEIAIPHHIILDSPKTAVKVILTPKGYYWGTNKVFIILLISVNQRDSQLFHILYEELIDSFANSNLSQNVVKIKKFVDLKTYLTSS